MSGSIGGVRCRQYNQAFRLLAMSGTAPSPVSDETQLIRAFHGVTFSIQYRSTASSAQKSTPTFTEGLIQTNWLLKTSP